MYILGCIGCVIFFKSVKSIDPCQFTCGNNLNRIAASACFYRFPMYTFGYLHRNLDVAIIYKTEQATRPYYLQRMTANRFKEASRP